jgi:hypothetical protein
MRSKDFSIFRNKNVRRKKYIQKKFEENKKLKSNVLKNRQVPRPFSLHNSSYFFCECAMTSFQGRNEKCTIIYQKQY